jgi:hypothetical protein
MAAHGLLHSPTYSELYSEPTNNHFGSNEEDLEACTRAVFEVSISFYRAPSG